MPTALSSQGTRQPSSEGAQLAAEGCRIAPAEMGVAHVQVQLQPGNLPQHPPVDGHRVEGRAEIFQTHRQPVAGRHPHDLPEG